MKWRPTSKKRPRNVNTIASRGASAPLTARSYDGKVRLVLYQESSGASAWRLTAPLFEHPWQDVLAESVINITARRFEPEPGYERAIELAGEALDAFSGLCRGWLSRGGHGEVACRSGCSHCCHQSVGITPLEGFAIVEHLRHTRSPEDLAAITSQLERRVAETAGLRPSEQYSPRFPCVFLADGACSIYPVRPLVCRGMNSLDAEACRKRMFDEVARTRFLTEGKDGQCYLEPIQGAKAVSAGLQFALTDLFGLEMNPGEMHVIVYHLLVDTISDGAKLSRRWIAGERGAFKSAWGR